MDKLCVNNIPEKCDAKDIREFFSIYGFNAKNVSKHKGIDFAFVELWEGVDNAISSLNDMEFNGQPISVYKADWLPSNK